MTYAADFETTTDVNDCRVWAWAVCEVGNYDNFKYGITINSLMEMCKKDKNNILYFHNLKFDGEFILYWLFHNGFKLNNDSKLNTNEFSTLISDTGLFYSIEICFKRTKKEIVKVKILDSLKILPFSVEKVAQAFNLPISKLSINYQEKREIGHKLTEEEISYIKNDVEIVARAIEILHKQGLTKMTTGANALEEYKKIISKKLFEKWFPPPLYDSDIRQAYKGGFTYLNPKYCGKDIKNGIVLDVNSLYPSVMYYSPLPYGEGKYFTGKYINDDNYNLYIQMFRCQFKLKKGYIPTIQLKNNMFFVPTEYLESSKGEYITMCLTNIDLELFFEHYEVYDIEYISGWKFRSYIGLFKNYIDKWNKIKVQATIEKNSALRAIAKLMLNSLYGKFALNPKVKSKYPFLGDDDIIHYRIVKEADRDPIYIPMGVFITSWARYKTITSAQKVYDRFIYADTDSLHLEGEEIPEGLEISDTELGKWKLESRFTKARFIRQKSYIEEIDNKLKITCAGMPESCYKYVTWDNFHKGAEYNGKLKISHTSGGIVLLESPHTLR